MTTQDQGWRIEIAGDRIEVERTHAGRFAVPVRIVLNGDTQATVSQVFTGDEIAELFTQTRALVAQDISDRPMRTSKADLAGACD